MILTETMQKSIELSLKTDGDVIPGKGNISK